MEKQIIEDIIHQLGYDFNHFDLHSFVDHIQKHRGRDIILVPVALMHEVSALWIRAETADYIFYNNTHHSIAASMMRYSTRRILPYYNCSQLA